MVAIGNGAGHRGEPAALEGDHGIVVPDGALEETLGVRRRRGQDDLQAGEMHPHRVRALRMLGGEANTAPGRASVGHGKIGLAAKHVADLARLIDDLIHGHEGERHHPPVHDGAEARARRAQAHAREHSFGDGREAHARGTELLDRVAREIGGEQDDPGIAPHLFGHRLFERLLKADLAHAALLPAFRRQTYRRADPSDRGTDSARQRPPPRRDRS